MPVGIVHRLFHLLRTFLQVTLCYPWWPPLIARWLLFCLAPIGLFLDEPNNHCLRRPHRYKLCQIHSTGDIPIWNLTLFWACDAIEPFWTCRRTDTVTILDVEQLPLFWRDANTHSPFPNFNWWWWVYMMIALLPLPFWNTVRLPVAPCSDCHLQFIGDVPLRYDGTKNADGCSLFRCNWAVDIRRWPHSQVEDYIRITCRAYDGRCSAIATRRWYDW